MTNRTIEVAERIMMSAQRDMWALADAVLTDVPAMPEGNPNYPATGGVGVSERLAHLATELDNLGITKADGSSYMPGYLRDVREVAMAWLSDERQAEASFDAHRENTATSRPVFLALCAHARGETVAVPEGIEAKAWKAALDKLATRRHGYKVQTQAVRIAMNKPGKNAPTQLDRATFGELIGHLSTGLDGLTAFASRIDQFELDEEDRTAMLRVLVRLRDKASMTITFLATTVDDAALRDLLEDSQ